MQTPFEPVRPAGCGERSGNGPRSVFGNYPRELPPPCSNDEEVKKNTVAPATSGSASRTAHGFKGLQTAMDTAVARAFLYRIIARAFEDPARENWLGLSDGNLHEPIAMAATALSDPGTASRSLESAARAWISRLTSGGFESFQEDYLAAFGHAARGLCPLNEIEYGDVKADPLFQPHRLADLAAFYQAFGLEVSGEATERQDHICFELEFMSVLAAKEAFALEHQLEDDLLALCRDAEKNFLREHLGRWTPAFTRRLARLVGEESPLGALAIFTRDFIAAECARFGIAPGSEDLLLRPVDAAAESLCASCGLTNLPPGALTTDS